jgi:hydroxypyruvate reductase
MDNVQNAIDVFAHAVAAVNPSTLIHNHLRWQYPYLDICGERIEFSSRNRLFIIGAGKAAAQMAETVEEILHDQIAGGIVITKHGHGLPLKKIKLYEAGHPIPDERSVLATEEIRRLADELTADDIVLFLLSGGASSLLADYPTDSNLEEVQEVFGLLLKSGATIHEMNTVRKHMSNVKGGQLARHIYPARLYSLILSDVIGDDLDVIGSGPTVPDKTTFADALAVLLKHDMMKKTPPSLARCIVEGCEGKITETPKEGDPVFAFTHNKIIGSNRMALEAASEKAMELGYQPQIITHTLQGESSTLGHLIAVEAIHYKGSLPACLLYGGESTVTIKGEGLGGRNMELALAAGTQIIDYPNITILAAGTDGTDGPTDAAGAVVNAAIMKQAALIKFNPTHFLERNDSYHFFSTIDGLIKTGPTQTNVMDLIVVLIHE